MIHSRRQLMRAILGLLVALSISAGLSPAAIAAEDGANALSMFLHNFQQPFVSKEFAERLGRLVLTEKYPGTTFSDEPTQLTDKGDFWEATFRIEKWPESMKNLVALSPQTLTVVIKKKDAAILGIK